MNKYQKALSDMVDNGVTVDYFNEKAKLPQSENPLFTIQELVDRATPMKPKGSLCAVCNEFVFEDDYYYDYKHTYCPNCVLTCGE